MRKLLTFVALSMVLILGSGLAWGFYMKSKLEASSAAFVEESFPEIFGSWSLDALRRRATPELLEALSKKDGSALFKIYSPLGPLRDYSGGGELAYLWSGRVTGVIATYKCSATFEKGDADITMHLHRSKRGE